MRASLEESSITRSLSGGEWVRLLPLPPGDARCSAPSATLAVRLLMLRLLCRLLNRRCPLGSLPSLRDEHRWVSATSGGAERPFATAEEARLLRMVHS